MKRFITILGLAITYTTLSGCSAPVPVYHGPAGPKNLTVSASTKGGTLSRITGEYYVYLSNDGCKYPVAGKIRFSQQPVAVSVKPGLTMVLTAQFRETGLGGGSTIEASQFFKVRPGMKYRAYAEYKNRGYKLVIHEARIGSAAGGRLVGRQLHERPPC